MGIIIRDMPKYMKCCQISLFHKMSAVSATTVGVTTVHNFMAAADSTVVLLEPDVQWD